MIRTIDFTVTFARRLHDFMGTKLVARLGPDHPLGRGMRCLDAPESMQSVADVVSVAQLEVAATSIITQLVGRGFDDRVIYDLRSAKDCRPLLFEATVFSELIDPFVGLARWRRYEEAASDIVASDPRLQVECSQMKGYSIDALIARAEEKLRQNKPGEGAYVAVVGTSVASRIHILSDVASPQRRRLEEWMGNHPQMAAFHLVAPRYMEDLDRVHEVDTETISLDIGRLFGITVRNVRALDPLPAGFEDNWVIES